MEEVVKEMSHLFQFFPEDIPPLNYPDPIDSTDTGGINFKLQRANIMCTFLMSSFRLLVVCQLGAERTGASLESCSSNSGLNLSNSSRSSALLTSLPVPSTAYPAASPLPNHVVQTEHLLPQFSQLLNPPLSPGGAAPVPQQSLGTNRNLPLPSSRTTEPLHLIIGENCGESAEGYALPGLGEDFLLGNQGHSRQPVEEFQPPTHQTRGLPRWPPQQFEQQNIKRRSVELPPVFTTPPSTASPQSVHSAGSHLPGWAGGAEGGGHRRSVSQGNPAQLWASITPQQSMPCISNLPTGRADRRVFATPSHFGELNLKKEMRDLPGRNLVLIFSTVSNDSFSCSYRAMARAFDA